MWVGETHLVGVIGDMTGGGTPTKDHLYHHYHHDHHHLHQNHHNLHHLFTQGDYVGSVHQSGGCFRTASSPICGEKKNILFFNLFLLFPFFHAGSPICDKNFFCFFIFHTCCLLELQCNNPKCLKYFSYLIFFNNVGENSFVTFLSNVKQIMNSDI